MAKIGFHFTKKKLLLLGFLFVILLVIPLTVYLVQQQQKTQSHATPNTTMSFTPSTQTAAVGDKVSFDITVSPGNNQISFIKLVLKFDSTKLSASSSSFTVNPASPLGILQGPVVGSDTISVSMSVGSDPTKVIQTDTKIGTVTFDVINGSTLPTEISFDPTTQVSSINGANNDGFNENVFLSGNPATITIQGGSEQANPSPALSPSPTPASSSGQSGTNESPVCSSLGSDVSATGVAPYAINFTASGTDSDGTISKVAFNFGEGTVQEVTSDGGIGTDSVDVTLAHTYETPGNYTASAVLTDDQGGTSDSVNCTMAISITDASGNGGTSTSTEDQNSSESATITPEVTPLPPTGPTQKLVGFGALGGILLLIGTLLFLAL